MSEPALSQSAATPCEAEKASIGDRLMSQAEHDRRVDYIEFLTTDIEEIKRFYSEVFGWEFTDYGPDLCCSAGRAGRRSIGRALFHEPGRDRSPSQ
jgi:hypothetical protein